MGSTFYRKYKRMLFIGLGVLIVLDSLALGLTKNLNLGLFAIFIALLGMSGLAYMDQKEGDAVAEEIRAEIEAGLSAQAAVLSPRSQAGTRTARCRTAPGSPCPCCRWMTTTRFFRVCPMRSARCWWQPWTSTCGNGRPG